MNNLNDKKFDDGVIDYYSLIFTIKDGWRLLLKSSLIVLIILSIFLFFFHETRITKSKMSFGSIRTSSSTHIYLNNFFEISGIEEKSFFEDIIYELNNYPAFKDVYRNALKKIDVQKIDKKYLKTEDEYLKNVY